MPMLFSPTIGAAVTARYWFLWIRCWQAMMMPCSRRRRCTGQDLNRILLFRHAIRGEAKFIRPKLD